MSHLMNTPFHVSPLRRFLLELTDGPFGSSLTSSHYSEDGARVIRLGNIGSAEFRNDDAAYIPLGYFNSLRRHEVVPGDLIIAGLGDQNHPVGRACVAPPGLGPAIVKADCFRARLDESRLLHRYSAWALSSSAISQQILTLTRGTTRARINLDLVRDIELPVPSVEEQRRIAEFLDVETVRLDALLAHRTRQTVLLEESDDSVITEMLDRAGGHPTRLKHLATKITSGPRGWGDLVADSGSLFLRITNIPRRGIRLDLRDSLYVDAEPGPERERSRTLAGDILISITADIGSVALVDERGADGNVSQHVALVRPNQTTCSPQWLAYALKSARSKQTLRMNSYGGTKVGLGLGDIANLVLAVPSLPTQAAIAAQIEDALEHRERLRRAMSEQIYLLRERRQALITAAVTGQFDVTTASGRNVTEGVTV